MKTDHNEDIMKFLALLSILSIPLSAHAYGPNNTFTNTPTITVSPTRTPSFTVSPTRTRTPTPTATRTPTPTATRTITPSPTRTRTPTPTMTPTRTITPSPTVTPTVTRTMTPMPTTMAAIFAAFNGSVVTLTTTGGQTIVGTAFTNTDYILINRQAIPFTAVATIWTP